MSQSIDEAAPRELLEWARTAEITTLIGLFERSVRGHGARSMLTSKRNGAWVSETYAQVQARVKCLARGLVALGVAPGERVAQVSPNRPEWVVADLGILYAGAVHVPVYPTLSASQVAHILVDSGARVVMVAGSPFLETLLEALSLVSHRVQHVVVHDDFPVAPCAVPVSGTRLWTLAEVTALGDEQAVVLEEMAQARRASVEAATVASIVYTSGTTGEPRGALLMHGNFTSNAISVAPCLALGPGDRELSFLPLCHVFERIACYALVSVGAEIAYAESVDLVLANMVEVRPTIVPSVPRLFEKIHRGVLEAVEKASPVRRGIFRWALSVGRTVLAHRQVRKRMTVALVLAHRLAVKLVFRSLQERMGGRIRFFISGGAALRREVAEFFHAVGLPVLEGYGLTETSPIITFNRADSVRLGTVGEALQGVQVCVSPADGEILCRGPNVMAGYLNRPEETRAAIDDQGWFHTGDVGFIDEGGYLVITDRKKELVVMSNGKKVAPQSIEALLKSCPYIDQAMVVGENRNFISALVYPRYDLLEQWAQAHGMSARGVDLAHEPRVQAFLQSKVDEMCGELAQFEKVKRISLLEREMSPETGEMTPTLKFRRRVVLERHREEIDRLYARESG